VSLGIGDGLALGRLADEALAIIREGDDGRRRARAFGVLDDLRRFAVHDGDAGIRRSEVDADRITFAHVADGVGSQPALAGKDGFGPRCIGPRAAGQERHARYA
jgi:hypothetical protein